MHDFFTMIYNPVAFQPYRTFDPSPPGRQDQLGVYLRGTKINIYLYISQPMPKRPGGRGGIFSFFCVCVCARRKETCNKLTFGNCGLRHAPGPALQNFYFSARAPEFTIYL